MRTTDPSQSEITPRGTCPPSATDLARGLVDGHHRAHHLLHHVATAHCHVGCGTGQFVGALGVGGVLLHGGRELLHRRGRLLQRAGLRLGARRQVAIAGGDFGRRGGNGVGAVAHLLYQVRKVIAHGADGADGADGVQDAGGVAGQCLHVHRQIAQAARRQGLAPARGAGVTASEIWRTRNATANPKGVGWEFRVTGDSQRQR